MLPTYTPKRDIYNWFLCVYKHVWIKILHTHNAHCGLYGGVKYKLLLKVLSHAWKLRSFFFMNVMMCLSNIFGKDYATKMVKDREYLH